MSWSPAAWTTIPLLLLAATLGLDAAETIGAGVTLREATPIARLIARPADFEGQTVRIEGVVTDVCRQMGCWMALAPDGRPEGDAVLLQVDHDGAIVFPLKARGRKAAAQGVVQRIGSAEGREAAAELANQ